MGSVARSLVVLFWLALCFSAVASADDALVLPKGRIRVGLEHLFFLPTDERWGPSGEAEELAGAFDDRALDSSIFPTLTALNPLVPGGRASIGDSTVHFEYQYNILSVTAAYGVTDRLTLGVDLPYYWVHNDVDVSVNAGPGSSANVGLRTGAGPGPCALPVAVLPLTCPNTRRFTTEDVQQILGPGLPGIPGFGFKRVKDFSADGLGDITLGLKYQYLRTEAWRLAATAGIRFPTGRRDDPDNLADIYWSTGAYTLLVRLHHDYLLSHLWNTRTLAASGPQSLRPGDLLLNCTLRYDGVLPDAATIRTGEPNALPTFRARVDRDLGDKFEVEVEARYALWTGFTLSGLYKYGRKLEDRISGPPGFPNHLAEMDTDATEHLYIVRVNYSTLPLYRARRFPIPLHMFLSYRDRFAGSGPSDPGSPSQVLKTRYIGVALQVLF
jgi:Putative MetA-pathway of phenol degradation